MKQITKAALVALIFTCSVQAQAQVKFGIKAGLNMSNVNLDIKGGGEPDTKMKPGFHIGVIADMGLADIISLQPGIIFNSKGFTIDESNEFGTFKSKNSLNYLEIPVNVAVKVSNFQFSAGPYVALGLGGKYKDESTYTDGTPSHTDNGKWKAKIGEVKNADIKVDEVPYNGLDLGIGLGAGYQAGSILIGINYSLGLSNINPKAEGATDAERKDFKYTNRVLSLSATFIFGN